jgi:hypothetical protein
MASIYQGWTPPVRHTDRELAIIALEAVEMGMTPDQFTAWFYSVIKPAGEMTIQEVRAIAEAWLVGDDCHHCEDAACTCKAHEEIIY